MNGKLLFHCISSQFLIQTPTNTPMGRETHRDRARQSEGAWKRELPFWILSKGFASHYGDLENSPCSLIPLLFLQLKGIQWKLIPWNECLPLLCSFCWLLLEMFLSVWWRKTQQSEEMSKSKTIENVSKNTQQNFGTLHQIKCKNAQSGKVLYVYMFCLLTLRRACATFCHGIWSGNKSDFILDFR